MEGYEYFIQSIKKMKIMFIIQLSKILKNDALKGLTQREFADVLDIDIRELFKPIDDDK